MAVLWRPWPQNKRLVVFFWRDKKVLTRHLTRVSKASRELKRSVSTRFDGQKGQAHRRARGGDCGPQEFTQEVVGWEILRYAFVELGGWKIVLHLNLSICCA